MESIITQVSRDDDIGTQQAKQQACERKRPARSKPRWGRLVYSLCCCIAPDADREKQANGARSNPTLLITTHKGQQHINSSGPVVANTYAVDGRLHNEYMPTPTVAVPVAIGSNESKAPHKETLASGSGKWLLPQVRPADANKKCLIIDLDETLVHSSFKPVKNPDFVIPVEIDGVVHQVYVLKRPYVDDFLARVGERFECVLFTASLAKYADPVADLLDKRGVFRARLFREACVYHRGNYVKDLSRLGRDLRRVVIIDNSPASYVFHPDNAVPVHTWFDDPTDSELLEILPVLEKIERLDSVYDAIGAGDEDNYRSSNNGQPTRVSVHESLLGVQPA